MGCLLRGIKRGDLKRGQIIAAPGSIKAVKKFMAQLYILSKDEGTFDCTRRESVIMTFPRWPLYAVYGSLPPTIIPSDC